jgi:hypothetical protein
MLWNLLKKCSDCILNYLMTSIIISKCFLGKHLLAELSLIKAFFYTPSKSAIFVIYIFFKFLKIHTLEIYKSLFIDNSILFVRFVEFTTIC